ncbi:tetraacyldisaccharide 4'-kinase [Terasakiella sp.]|uniref:tetraacyldisaccharide 4'-kinase n=1 Tax=Terasakiella sp. TaxID=2034861 RepID=UPI003AA7EAA5
MKQAPSFWGYGYNSLWETVLSPLACLYNKITCTRAERPALWKAPIPVICIGNLTMGGAGKTPTAMAIAQYLQAAGKNPYFLSRGFGGHMKGPLMVGGHGTHEVGDEPLLLKEIAPVCVSRDRVAGAKLCVKKGADVIVMDDGFQNPHLHKDVSFLVVDGGYGHGNEKVFPAGPLRESLQSGLQRADGLVLIGADMTGALERVQRIRADIPVLQAYIQPLDRPDLVGRKVLAFAGIGRPEKFFETLRTMDCDLLDCVPFPDHHPYLIDDIRPLRERAKLAGARLITTRKDYMRLPKEFAQEVDVIKISLVWQGEDMLKAVLSKITDLA